MDSSVRPHPGSLSSRNESRRYFQYDINLTSLRGLSKNEASNASLIPSFCFSAAHPPSCRPSGLLALWNFLLSARRLLTRRSATLSLLGRLTVESVDCQVQQWMIHTHGWRYRQRWQEREGAKISLTFFKMSSEKVLTLKNNRNMHL